MVNFLTRKLPVAHRTQEQAELKMETCCSSESWNCLNRKLQKEIVGVSGYKGRAVFCKVTAVDLETSVGQQ